MKVRFELDEEEQQIDDEIDHYVPVDAGTEAKVRRIAQESRTRKNVNIRISEWDLSQIRDRASREGVPYQTLIASVLHEYVIDQLYDEQEIRKAIELIGSSGPKELFPTVAGSESMGMGLQAHNCRHHAGGTDGSRFLRNSRSTRNAAGYEAVAKPRFPGNSDKHGGRRRD